MKGNIKIYIVLMAIFAFFAWGCDMVKNLKEDSYAEELLEDVLEKNTGIDVDLTPNSKEDD